MTGPYEPSLPRRSLAIALVAAAVLLYEIAVTRVLSVVVGYHFAFLAISLAMLGLGAPGVWFALRPPGWTILRRALLVAGIAVPGSIAVLFAVGKRLPSMVDKMPTLAGLAQPGVLLAVSCVLAALLALGTALAPLLIRARDGEIPTLYGSDLVGAAVGALLVVPLMTFLPTPHLLAAAGLLPLAAALVLFHPMPRAAWGVGAVLVASLLWGGPYRLDWTKYYVESGRLYERWTPTARITVFSELFWREDPTRAFGWGMGSRWVPYATNPLWIEQDGSAGTPIVRYSGKPSEVRHLFFDVTSAPYAVRPPRRVAVIGAGGGKDVLTALASGAERVDAVELNPAIVEAVSGPFREVSGGVYDLPGVRAEVAEGRSFLSKSAGGYDAIQISLIDSWAATSGGAYALSENYLYTVEALRLYLSKLSDRGFLSISRWGTGAAKMETARLVLMTVRAMEEMGIPDPRARIFVVQARFVATVAVSKTPWSPAEIAVLDRTCAERGFVRHWPLSRETPGDSIVGLMLAEGPARVEAHGFDLSPATDDRPFFFQTLRIFAGVSPEILGTLSTNEQSVLLLRRLLVLVMGIAAALFFLPFVLARRLPRGRSFWRGSLYFFSIGAAYMLVQVPWVQRFTLPLGHPSYATTVVLAAMLVGTGLGALLAGRVSRSVALGGLAVLPVLLAFANALAGPFLAATLGSALPVRIAATVAIVLPAGLLMGLAFPTGIARFGQSGIAWFWAVNGFAGVLASVLSLALAMAVGLTATAWVAAGIYLVAAALLLGKDAANHAQA